MTKIQFSYFSLPGLLILGPLIFATSCGNPFSLGIKNPKHFKYSREEVKRAMILSISAKLEKKFHTDQKASEFKEMDDDQLDDKSRQIDFLRRIKENE